MSQSRQHSALETVANVAIGYVISVAAQAVILPMFGLHASLGENIGISAMFTVVSVVRSYALRRLFNAWHARSV